jgi:toxin-antitoxin system PIN domain toxin
LIAVDSNILVYAHRPDSPFHAPAAARITTLAEGRAPWAIPWPCLHEFLAIVTRPRYYDPPTPMPQAMEQVGSWLESPTLVVLTESQAHWETLRALLESAHVVGGRVHDARIAALCLEHGVRELWTADRDFSRFGGLVTLNPLVR